MILLVLVLLNLPSHTAAHIKLAISGLFLPLYGFAGSAQSATEHAANSVLPRNTLAKELERLRLENEQLRIQLQQSDETRRENARLRQTVAWKQQAPWNLKLARVIGRDPSNWWRTLHIDRGSADGVRENMPVLTAEGVVGRIGTVGAHRSQVILLGDPNCRVAAVVFDAQNKERETGVIGPAASEVLDHTIVNLGFLARGGQLQPGQMVYTSGQGGIFPKGIRVGRIIDTRSIGYGLYLEARVKLEVDNTRVEEVWVLFP
ncbi:MAG: rod shape-determining protein MreC [Verrucomicrobiota bacterium]